MKKKRISVKKHKRRKRLGGTAIIKKHHRWIKKLRAKKQIDLSEFGVHKKKKEPEKPFLETFKDTSKVKEKSEEWKTGQKQKGLLGFMEISEKALDKGMSMTEQQKYKKLTHFGEKEKSEKED
jgi:hypothetical protein